MSDMKRWPFLASTMLATALLATSSTTWGNEPNFPPELPGGETVVTDEAEEFLRAPEGAELHSGVRIAETAPRIDFMYFPGQDYKGDPWAVWGDGLGVGNNKFYASVSDHAAPRGRSLVYEYDAETQELRTLVDLREFLEDGLLPEGMDYTPGKVHSRIDQGRDGWLYYSTHRGSTRDNTTDERGYLGDWIFRTNPETAETEIVAAYPVEKHTIPASVLDPERMIFYGGSAPGNDASIRERQFLAYDVENGRTLLQTDGGFGRYAILAQSTGKVYWDGKVYDPETNEISSAPAVPEVRSATRETEDGMVYGTTGNRLDIWGFNTRTEEVTQLGDGAVSGHGYVTAMEIDPTGRYLYYIPGAHGGIADVGTPIIQFDVETQTPKVLAFVGPYYHEKYGYTPDGTFGIGISEDGAILYVAWNGNRIGESGSRHWDSCALMAIHIPESERQ